ITLRYKLGNGGYSVDSASVDADGNWSWTPNTLAKGSWTFEVQKAGQSGWSSFKLTIDPALDLKPTIDSAWDDFGAVTGSLTSGDTTDDNTPTLRGTGVAGTIILFQNGLAGSSWNDVGSTVVKADGTWEWTSPVLSKNGTWEFHAKAQNGDVISGWTGKFILKYVAAAGPVITDALDDVGPVTGSLSSGASTDDSTPTLRGTGPANSTITLRYKLGSGSYASTTVSVDNAGNWSWTPSGLAKGSWTFEVQKSGQNGWSSFKLTIDPALDMQPTIDDAWDNFGAVTGSLKNGDTTDDSTPTLRGKGVAGTIIHIQSSPPGVPWEPVGSTVVKADGTWEWTSPALKNSNTWDFQAQAQNGDHYSAWSNKFVVKYVAAAPDKPVIVDAFDDVGPVTGSVKHNGYTDDSTPTLRGRGVAGSIIHFQNGPWDKPWVNVGSTVVKADGTWEWTSPALDHSDNWHFRAYVENSSGQSDWSESFILNYTDPAPTITDAFDDFGAETGSLASGDTTDDQTPTLRGTAPADSVVMIRAQHASGEKTYSVKAGADGKWSWTPDTALAKGDWDFQVKQSEVENWGESFELSITKDYSGRKGIVDFEDMYLGPRYGAGILFNGNCALVWGSRNSPEVLSAYIIQKPNGAPDYFGEHCLIPNWAQLEIQGGKIVDIGFDVYNRGTTDLTFRMTVSSRIAETYTIKPGETLHFDRDSYKNTFDGTKTESLALLFFGPANQFVFDNIYTIVTPPSTSAQLVDEPENIVHFLDGVDELTEHAITGSETQVDTLQLTGKDQLLDLSQHQAEIQSVEIFDIRGSGDNTLKIDLDALLHYGEKDLFIEDGKTQLMINGDAGDVVQLKDILPEGSDISEWQHQQGTVTVAGVEYEVYSHGDDAELLVQQGVKTELI
ncbi:Ig-like domain-containing protein, partial [Pantoea endophytica]